MKRNYIYPQVTIYRIGAEQIIAASTDTLQRGTAPEGGGNNAEVKRQHSTEFSNPVNWDE